MSNSVAHTYTNFNDNLETKPRRKGGRPKKEASVPFVGFTQESIGTEYFRVPAIFLSLCAMIDNLAELKVVLYIMRHTWGFREYDTPKRITIDEFVNGRKRVDGSRMDLGTGLSESAVKDGLQRAIDHEIIVCYVDDRDMGRIKNYYELKMQYEAELESPEEVTPSEKTEIQDENDEVTEKSPQATFFTEDNYPEQETEDYDPYAGTIFAQQSAPNTGPANQKIFVSEAEFITPSDPANNIPTGSHYHPRTENRTEEQTLRTNDIRNAHPQEKVEEMIRFLPKEDQLSKPKQKAPAFIRNMIRDFSKDLGDQDHIFSNISQAAKIYRNSRVSEEDFMQALYDARALAKKATQIKHLNSHGNPNRMPYFFRCLSGVLR